MRKNTVFRGWLLLALVAAAFFVRVPRAEAQACVAPGSLSGAVRTVYGNFIQPGIHDTGDRLKVEFAGLTDRFINGFTPIVEQVDRGVGGWFETFFSYNILPYMQAATRQLTVLMDPRVFAAATVADRAQLVRTRAVAGGLQLESQRDLRVGGNVCAAATLMPGMRWADDVSRAFATASTREMLARTANNRGTPSATGAISDASARWKRYLYGYCDKEDNNGAVECHNTGVLGDIFGFNADGKIVARDLDLVGMIFTRDTIDIDPARDGDGIKMLNLKNLVVNIAEPFAKDPLGPGFDAQSAEKFVARNIYKARRQAVYDSLYHVISQRVPANLSPDYVDSLATLLGDPGASRQHDIFHTDRRLVDPKLDDSTDRANPSRLEILRALMTSRTRSGTFAAAQIGEPANNARDLVIQQALQLIQTSDQIDLMDHYALLLAAQAGTELGPKGQFLGTGIGTVPLPRFTPPSSGGGQ